MNSHIVFAVNRIDAARKCEQLGLPFDQTMWVMNFQLLGAIDTHSYTPHFTDTFMGMPAFREAALAFDLDPDTLMIEGSL